MPFSTPKSANPHHGNTGNQNAAINRASHSNFCFGLQTARPQMIANFFRFGQKVDGPFGPFHQLGKSRIATMSHQWNGLINAPILVIRACTNTNAPIHEESGMPLNQGDPTIAPCQVCDSWYRDIYKTLLRGWGGRN